MANKRRAGNKRVSLYLPGWIIAEVRNKAMETGECEATIIRQILIKEFTPKQGRMTDCGTSPKQMDDGADDPFIGLAPLF